MAQTKYTYNQNVANIDLLLERIAASAIAETVDYAERVEGSPDAVDVYFLNALSGADQTTLDGILADQDLEEAKAAKRKAINDYRDYKLYVVKYTWPTDGHTYDMDSISQFKMAATLAFHNAGNSLPGDFTWRDAGNTDRAFTNNQFKNFCTDLWTRANDVHVAGKTHKDNVTALTTVADVNSYDYTTSPAWPT